MKTVEIIYLYLMIFGTVGVMIVAAWIGPETRKLTIRWAEDLRRMSEMVARIAKPTFHIAWFALLGRVIHLIK
jgi:hypothetical protein